MVLPQKKEICDDKKNYSDYHIKSVIIFLKMVGFAILIAFARRWFSLTFACIEVALMVTYRRM